MESRLKERLTGAAILVALIVLIVPEMFHGQREPSAGNTAANSEGPPLRSFTIELHSAGAHATPMQITPTARSTIVPSGQAALTPAARAPTPSLPRAAPSAPTVPTASTVPTAPPAAKAPVAQAALARTPDGGAASGWSVQLGLFAKSANAQRLVRTAHDKGFTAQVSKADAKGLYRVSIVGLADRPAAEQLLRQLRAAGIPAAVIGPR